MNLDVEKLGKKRPQVSVPFNLIKLDGKNPRIEEEGLSNSKEEILIKYFIEEYDLEGLGNSLAENGYFEEEPIIIVPEKIPKDFNWKRDMDEIEEEIGKLINLNSINFTVIEGNRRISTIKLLLDSKLREKLKIDRTFPKIVNQKVKKDLESIPSIIYHKREEVLVYLGIKHIEGPLKWGAYSKAKYIAKMIEIEKKPKRNINQCVKIVQEKIADRSDVIKKQYMAYRLFEQIKKESLEVNLKEIIRRFSLIGELLNNRSVRDFIKIPSYTEMDFSKNLIPKKNLANAELLLGWVFGSENKQPIITDSRKIRFLTPILANRESTEHLIKYESLEDAFELSGGERMFLIKKLLDIKRAISSALGLLFKFKKDVEVKELIGEINEAATALIKNQND